MSQKIYTRSLFIFRKDLRINDNTGLIQALTLSEQVISIFIFDPRQIGPKNNYASSNALQFMIESLNDLEKQIKHKKGSLYFFYGIAEKIVKKIISQEDIDAVFINKDYTPFSIQRDNAIKKICSDNDTIYHAYADTLLNDPDDIATKKGTPYAIFTPFFKQCRSIKVKSPKKNLFKNYFTGKIKGVDHTAITKIMKSKNNHLWINGGTQEAKKIIKKIKNLKNYKKTRDYPHFITSNLSAHNKFGTVSIKEVYHAIIHSLGTSSPLITQLYWRDFFYHVAYHAPFVFGKAYHKKYNALKWRTHKKIFEHWCNGTTGFPIIDAGMRQLNTTGYMHNRVRMLVASFLTKDLHISWLWGEKYFAQKLIDYDPCVNNGNWQWAASTGCDSQPYFRIFNPWIQQKKFDPDALYIKQWVPELNHLPSHTIHQWYAPKNASIETYYRPIVDHSVESKITKQLFKSI